MNRNEELENERKKEIERRGKKKKKKTTTHGATHVDIYSRATIILSVRAVP